MLNFKWVVLTGWMVTCVTSAARAQQVQGFAVERLYPSSPGGGWVVMDALDMRGGLGGGAEMLVSYAHDPLRVAQPNGGALDVVRDQAFADLGFAATYDRFRLSFNLDMPLVTHGFSGTVGTYQFTAPSVDLGSNPDTLSDARIGFDARILGGPHSPFRLGASAQLLVPSGVRADYDTDGTYRAMFRALFAGDIGVFSYAGQVGVHVRPLDDSPAPGAANGSELLFGIAAGVKLLVDHHQAWALAFGPEVFGASAFRSFFGSTTTALESLFSVRLEGVRDNGPQLRFKLGAGPGLDPQFGAPDWRLVFAVEVFDHHSP